MSQSTPDLVELNQQLDQILASEDALNTALSSDNPLLQAAARLIANQHPQLSNVARGAILEQVTTAPISGTTTPTLLRPQFTSWMGRIAAVFLITVFVGLAAQPVAANSLPGEPLYPVKIQGERLALALAPSPEARAKVHLSHVENRLAELDALGNDSPRLAQTWDAAATSLENVQTLVTTHHLYDENAALELQTRTVTEQVSTLLENRPPVEDIQAEVNATTDLLRESFTDSAPQPEATEATEITDTTSENPEETNGFASFEMFIHPDGNVNVRASDTTNSEIVRVGNQNTPVTVIGINAAGDWYQVQLPDGTQGWIMAALLDETPGQSSADERGSSNSNRNGNANGNQNGNANGNQNGNARRP